MYKAADRLLGKSDSSISELVTDIALGQMRLELATQHYADLCAGGSGLAQFACACEEKITYELKKLGISVLLFDVSGIRFDKDLENSFKAVKSASQQSSKATAHAEGIDREAMKLTATANISEPSETDIDVQSALSGDATGPTDDVRAMIKKMKARGMMSSEIAEITGVPEIDILNM